MKPRPSNKPTNISEDSWFYERRGGIDLIHWCKDVEGKKRHASTIKIPWKLLMQSAARCRPEQVASSVLKGNNQI